MRTVLIIKSLKRDIRKQNPADIVEDDGLTNFLWISDRNVQIKLVLTFLFLQLYVKKGRRKPSEKPDLWGWESQEMQQILILIQLNGSFSTFK